MLDIRYIEKCGASYIVKGVPSSIMTVSQSGDI